MASPTAASLRINRRSTTTTITPRNSSSKATGITSTTTASSRKQAGIPTGFRRNLAIEEFSFNDDGTIKKVAYTTNGVAQLGHLDPFARVEGETFNAQSGVETEPCSEGGMNLTDLNNGDWVRIVGVDFGTKGAKKFSARVASAGAGRQHRTAPRRPGRQAHRHLQGGEHRRLADMEDRDLRCLRRDWRAGSLFEVHRRGAALLNLDHWSFHEKRAPALSAR